MPDFHAIIASATGLGVVSSTPCAGGCIHEARLYTLADGSRVFAKTHAHADAMPGVFTSEADALRRMADAGSSLMVPRPIAAGADYIVMEAIDEAPAPSDFAERLAFGLAELHRNARCDRFGFERDNYLGLTPQPNGWLDDWTAFWAERRLKPMLDRVRGDAELDQLGSRLLDRLDGILDGPRDAACLLHGDLWSGNAAAADGRAALFDPAAYYGHREADLGMTRMFGFGPHFEPAYHAAFPLADGCDRRINVYQLYHHLNHLHLFGPSYHAGCLALLRSIL